MQSKREEHLPSFLLVPGDDLQASPRSRAYSLDWETKGATGLAGQEGVSSREKRAASTTKLKGTRCWSPFPVRQGHPRPWDGRPGPHASVPPGPCLSHPPPLDSGHTRLFLFWRELFPRIKHRPQTAASPLLSLRSQLTRSPSQKSFPDKSVFKKVSSTASKNHRHAPLFHVRHSTPKPNVCVHLSRHVSP